MKREAGANVTLGLTRKSLEAVRIYACPKCGAPGTYKNDEHNRINWPGIYDPSLLPGQTKLVGDVCPNCGAKRKADKNLGELTASMPKWLWNIVLGFKWCLIQMIFLSRKIRRVN